MAIQVLSIKERPNGAYTLTVQDTDDQTGTDEKSNPIYRTYSTGYSTSEGVSVAKQRILAQIGEQKTKAVKEAEALATVKTEIESIDTSKI
jgi:hypothetical protein